jgi:putative intracellular protease/amidase
MTTATVHVAVYDTLADWEIGHATAHIADPSWQRQPDRYRIETVGLTIDPVTTKGGLRIRPDRALATLSPAESAMLILPGADTWLDGSLVPFAEAAIRFVEAGVPVAAICGATAGLALVGLLDDRQHTSNAREFLEGLGYGGADRYVDAPAVTDGDVITATAVAPVEFAREIFRRLDLYAPEVLASWYKLFGEHDPAGYHELVASAS